jgi:hypothetical protein
MLCATLGRPSNRARQRALNVTNIEIESSQKRTTGEAIYAVDGFALHVGINIPEGYGFRATQRALVWL